MGQPVFGIIHNDPDQFLLVQVVEEADSFISGSFGT
jgi:hypothetical protein